MLYFSRSFSISCWSYTGHVKPLYLEYMVFTVSCWRQPKVTFSGYREVSPPLLQLLQEHTTCRSGAPYGACQIAVGFSLPPDEVGLYLAVANFALCPAFMARLTTNGIRATLEAKIVSPSLEPSKEFLEHSVFIMRHYRHPRSSLASASSLRHPRYAATVALILGCSAMAGQSQTPRMPKWLSHTSLANRLTPLPPVVHTSTDDSMCRPLVDRRPRLALVPAPRATCDRWAAEASSPT